MIHQSNWFIYCWLQPGLIDLLHQTQAHYLNAAVNGCDSFTEHLASTTAVLPHNQHSAITRVPPSASSQLWCVKTPNMAVWKTFKSDSQSLWKFISAVQLVLISSQRAGLSIRNLFVKHFASCRPFLFLTHKLGRYNNWPFWPLGDSATNFTQQWHVMKLIWWPSAFIWCQFFLALFWSSTPEGDVWLFSC